VAGWAVTTSGAQARAVRSESLPGFGPPGSDRAIWPNASARGARTSPAYQRRCQLSVDSAALNYGGGSVPSCVSPTADKDRAGRHLPYQIRRSGRLVIPRRSPVGAGRSGGSGRAWPTGSGWPHVSVEISMPSAHVLLRSCTRPSCGAIEGQCSQGIGGMVRLPQAGASFWRADSSRSRPAMCVAMASRGDLRGIR
jgi:hypothetical protein